MMWKKQGKKLRIGLNKINWISVCCASSYFIKMICVIIGVVLVAIPFCFCVVKEGKIKMWFYCMIGGNLVNDNFFLAKY